MISRTNLESHMNDPVQMIFKRQMEKVINTLDNREEWLSLTIIEKNTTGLTGPEDPDRSNNERSKFDALMRAVGKTDKDEAIAGGTFGKGSSVYTYSSGVWMWFAYSFLEKPENHEQLTSKNYTSTQARFMGRGMIAPFVNHKEKTEFAGHRWYCREQYALPFINEEADL